MAPLALAGIAACAPDTGADSSPMTVEVDVYSGRQNPRWSLSGEERAAVLARLASLPAAQGRPLDRLGFRGFVIHNPERAEGLPARIVVSSGVVVMDGDDQRVFGDTRALEQYLRARATVHGFGELVSEPGREHRDSSR